MLVQQATELTVEDDEHSVAIELSDGGWVVLEGSARSIWEELRDPIEVDEVVARLRNRYESEDDITSDVTAAIAEWIELGIAVRRP